MNITELKVEMTRNNVNQEEFSKMINISPAMLSKKLNGACKITREDIVKIKSALNLSPVRIDEIFFNEKVE